MFCVCVCVCEKWHRVTFWPGFFFRFCCLHKNLLDCGVGGGGGGPKFFFHSFALCKHIFEFWTYGFFPLYIGWGMRTRFFFLLNSVTITAAAAARGSHGHNTHTHTQTPVIDKHRNDDDDDDKDEQQRKQTVQWINLKNKFTQFLSISKYRIQCK